MWEKYELGLGKPTMSFLAKTIVWILFFEWIKFLVLVSTTDVDTYIVQLINVIVLLGVIWGAASTTNHYIPVEAWVYIKNLFTNRPQELNYWVSESSEDKDDKSNWIFKY
jgi:hypothetical protein